MNCLFRSILSVAGLLALAVTANAQTVPDNVGTSSTGLPTALRNVGFEPPLNGQIPLSLAFRDEYGRDVHLGDYFGHKPVLLALVYYGCPMLCNQVEQGVVGSLKMLSFNAGRDYDVVFVSFDPRETPDMAAQKKVSALSHYGRPDTAAGWHFLTGAKPSIDSTDRSREFPLLLQREDRHLRARQRHHAAHSGRAHLALFLRRGVSVARRAPRSGRRFRRQNRQSHRPSAALLFPVRPVDRALQRHHSPDHSSWRSFDDLYDRGGHFDFPASRYSRADPKLRPPFSGGSEQGAH